MFPTIIAVGLAANLLYPQVMTYQNSCSVKDSIGIDEANDFFLSQADIYSVIQKYYSDRNATDNALEHHPNISGIHHAPVASKYYNGRVSQLNLLYNTDKQTSEHIKKLVDCNKKANQDIHSRVLLDLEHLQTSHRDIMTQFESQQADLDTSRKEAQDDLSNTELQLSKDLQQPVESYNNAVAFRETADEKINRLLQELSIARTEAFEARASEKKTLEIIRNITSRYDERIHHLQSQIQDRVHSIARLDALLANATNKMQAASTQYHQIQNTVSTANAALDAYEREADIIMDRGLMNRCKSERLAKATIELNKLYSFFEIANQTYNKAKDSHIFAQNDTLIKASRLLRERTEKIRLQADHDAASEAASHYMDQVHHALSDDSKMYHESNANTFDDSLNAILNSISKKDDDILRATESFFHSQKKEDTCRGEMIAAMNTKSRFEKDTLVALLNIATSHGATGEELMIRVTELNPDTKLEITRIFDECL
ncbi:hypothetical protein TetV_390 [Tetraselmis virus 1]|uniref:Uncharacterized protein n=1 Tax=Tetraselmis virus 1 TaxID=2060617 RepID=A0A2P0VNL2_9VIRU|nr:hypothetical protein QJ968_gp390 [Tetraselmis virus 1]AUF82482.1 hypothetical protein TetV_390 [Tetraselmis virus 1]